MQYLGESSEQQNDLSSFPKQFIQYHSNPSLCPNQTPGVDDELGNLAGSSVWGCKELNMTKPLNWTELNWCCLFLQVVQFLIPSTRNPNSFGGPDTYSPHRCFSGNGSDGCWQVLHHTWHTGPTQKTLQLSHQLWASRWLSDKESASIQEIQ